MFVNIQKTFPGLLLVLFVACAALTTPAQCSEPSLPAGSEVVGAWRGLSGEGNPILLSANSDGLIRSSVVSEVSLSLRPNVLTQGHGVWKHVGGRTFEMTGYGLFYSISTGKYQGYLKALVRVTVSADCSTLTGTDKVFIYGPTGVLLFAVPEGPTTYVRTVPENYE